MDIIPAEQCQQEWGDNLGPLTPAQICASRRTGICRADSGDYQGYLSLSLFLSQTDSCHNLMAARRSSLHQAPAPAYVAPDSMGSMDPHRFVEIFSVKILLKCKIFSKVWLFSFKFKIFSGVTSFGSSFCGHSRKPTVFTRVSAYIDWIRDELKP